MNRLIRYKYGWLAALILAAALIVTSSMVNLRLDFTEENRYTLSEASKKLIRETQEPTQITVLLKGDPLPVFFRKLAGSSEFFLKELKSRSQGNITYRFVTPDEFMTDAESFPVNDTLKTEWLKQNAVKQNEITQTGTRAAFVYPIALLQQEDRMTTVNLLQGQGNKGFLNPDNAALQYELINNAESQMEYLFMSALQALSDAPLPVIAYETGHGQPTGPNTFDLSSNLQSRFNFFVIDIKERPFISDSIDVLMIVKPELSFKDEEKLKIDQFIMRGGRVMFLLDGLNADMDSLIRSGRDFTAFPRDLKLEDLLFRYGARINFDLVEDAQCDMLPQTVGMIGNQPQIELMPWPYFPLLYSQSNHPVAKNLDAVVMQFPNSVDTVKADGIEKDILLTTSNTSKRTNAPVIVTVEVLKMLENPSAFPDKNIPVALMLSGKFQSLYANRLPGATAESLAARGQPFLPKGVNPGMIMITGDGDWVLNAFTREGPMPMGSNPYTQYEFANKDFLMNAIDFMTDEKGIMASRSKSFQLRVLDPKKLESNKPAIQWANVALPVLLLGIFGLAFVIWRRKKYSR